MMQHAGGQTIIKSTRKCMKMRIRGIDWMVDFSSTLTGPIDMTATDSQSDSFVAENIQLPGRNRPSKFWQIIGVVVAFLAMTINFITSR